VQNFGISMSASTTTRNNPHWQVEAMALLRERLPFAIDEVDTEDAVLICRDLAAVFNYRVDFKGSMTAVFNPFIFK
jgi:hypothetical protein